MRKKALFKTDIKPACAHCKRGKQAPDGNSVLCARRGVMLKHSHCAKYQYDPLKRIPPRTPVLPEFDPEQFIL
ncbi:MAG: hypothetical protein LBB67_06300 [Oscillospiraceae bacterium]|jgi:hypothetical protein|nr:hypothetical protein [Oscillospiraceae bacterium]